MRLSLKVVPGATRPGVAGWLGDTLKLRVREAPEKGRANAAVVALLAEVLELPPAQIRVVAGHGTPRKQVEIMGLDEAELRRRIAASG